MVKVLVVAAGRHPSECDRHVPWDRARERPPSPTAHGGSVIAVPSPLPLLSGTAEWPVEGSI